MNVFITIRCKMCIIVPSIAAEWLLHLPNSECENAFLTFFTDWAHVWSNLWLFHIIIKILALEDSNLFHKCPRYTPNSKRFCFKSQIKRVISIPAF